MNIIEQVKQTLINEIKTSIKSAKLIQDQSIPEIKIEIPKDSKMVTILPTLRWS